MRGYQYPLRLPPLRRLEREDFMPGTANLAALTFIESWPRWPAPTLVLQGPAGSGKSHLANIWQERARAQRLDPARLAREEPRALLGNAKALLVEDADRLLAVEPALGPALYALHFALTERGGWLLLTARAAPAHWQIALPDLRSRLVAAPTVAIGQPDDALLATVLVKLLSDRQLECNAHVLSYLAPRVERSLEAVQRLADRLDAGAMAARRRRRRVTLALAKRVLRSLDGKIDDTMG
ncbi:MAG: hypothetical protein Kilf2KO_38440 [Rhodospirillales bacterium]